MSGPLKLIDNALYDKNGHTKGEGWVKCDELKEATLGRFSVNLDDRKMICVASDFNLTKSLKTFLKDVKCFEIPSFGDNGYQTKNNPGNLSPDEIFHYLLNPSDVIMEEIANFTKLFLTRPYVAIHIRANHLNIFPTTTNRCFTLAMRIVDELKKKRGVKYIYLSTDMSKYGGSGSRDLGHEEYFAKMSGAVTYSPKYTGKIDSISRCSVQSLMLH